MSLPIGDPRPAGETGPAGDQREAGSDAPAGDPRPAGAEAEDGTITVTTDDDGELKGKELDQALEDAGLPKTGTADEKRQRLAEYRAS